MTQEQARKAFQYFFDLPWPESKKTLNYFTPGDFVVVAKKASIMNTDNPLDLIEMLNQELEIKNVMPSKLMGFAV